MDILEGGMSRRSGHHRIMGSWKALVMMVLDAGIL
jgi:hypothetical protein